jgi:hypothetical protein
VEGALVPGADRFRAPQTLEDHMEVILSAPFMPIPQGALAALADPLVMLAIAVGALSLAYLFIRLRQGRGAGMPMPAADAPQRQMHALLQELEEASLKMSADIDAKATRLEALIADADARSAALSALLARAHAHNIAQKLIAGVADNADSGLGALARHREIYDLADSGDTPAAIAQKLGRPAGEVELILALRGS